MKYEAGKQYYFVDRKYHHFLKPLLVTYITNTKFFHLVTNNDHGQMIVYEGELIPDTLA